MVSSSRNVLFSGGGTAGHLAPGFALAAALEARGASCIFATPGESVEETWFAGRSAPRHIHARRLPRSLGTKLGFPFHLLRGVLQARRLLRRTSSGCLVALGGWPCAPAALAARWTRTPLVFLVPDAVPGLVVRKFARWASRIYVANEVAGRALEPHPGLRVTGPLLRGSVRSGARAPEAFGLSSRRLTLLVTGGSLGAQALNERVLDGLSLALEERPALGDEVQMLHSAGEEAEAVGARYDALGLTHHTTAYIEDMGSAYRTADLVLARAGASTCAEVAQAATPAVFVPYPHHADRQQFLNAEPLVRRGVARVIEQAELTPSTVRDDVLGLLRNRDALGRMRAAAFPQEADPVALAAADLVRFMGEGAVPPAPLSSSAKEV